MSRLVLFTNDYPYRRGDFDFVDGEIRDLADRFDSVVVFCHARDTSVGRGEMPANVVLGGNLFEPTRARQLLRLAHPRTVADVIAALFAEARWGRLRGDLRRLLLAVVFGVTRAGRADVRAAVSADPRTVAYAFWGMGGGLTLPWLHGVAARVVRLHRYDLYEHVDAGGSLPLRPFLFSRVDRILVISDDGRRYLERTSHDPAVAAKTTLSRLGVFGPAEVSRAAPGATRLIVSCSSVTDVKRVDLIAASLAELLRERPDRAVRWVHFGEGPRLPELRDAVGRAPDGLTVELRGQTPHEEVLAFYGSHRVDAFVNLSSSEGVPVSIMEAIAFDIPVVATAVGGTPEIVSSRLKTGELVPANPSPAEAAGALARVLDDPDGRYHPRDLWSREYDARVNGARTAELVVSLLPEETPGAREGGAAQPNG